MQLITQRALTAHVYHSASRTLCRTCQAPIDAKVLLRDGAVWLDAFCPDHGADTRQVASSADWFLECVRFLGPIRSVECGTRSVVAGCPTDCGVCAAHEQRPHRVILDASAGLEGSTDTEEATWLALADEVEVVVSSEGEDAIGWTEWPLAELLVGKRVHTRRALSWQALAMDEDLVE